MPSFLDLRRCAGLAVLLAACGGGDASGRAGTGAPLTGEPVPFAEVPTAPLPSGAIVTGYHQPARLVLRSEAEWAAAWAVLQASVSPPAPLPEVDFSREQVVLAALGDRPSSGYAVRVASVECLDAALRVEVEERRPGPRCVVATLITSPVRAFRLPRSDLPVEFADEVVTEDCP